MEFRLDQQGHDNLGNWEEYLEVEGRYRVRKRIRYSTDHACRKICWLAITPLGNTLLNDWRDEQTIKNHFCGSECEAVEIYPPESDLVDANNNFHLWVYLDGYRLLRLSWTTDCRGPTPGPTKPRQAYPAAGFRGTGSWRGNGLLDS